MIIKGNCRECREYGDLQPIGNFHEGCCENCINKLERADGFAKVSALARICVQRLSKETTDSTVNADTRLAVLEDIFQAMRSVNLDLRDRNSVLALLSAFQVFDADLHMDMPLAELERNIGILMSAITASVFKTDTLRHLINDEKITALQTILDSQNTLVTARAGSGKTRLLLALISILVQQYGVDKHEILLLSFNKTVAEKNKCNLKKDFGMSDYSGACTLHALAHRIVASVDPGVRDKMLEDQSSDTKLLEFIKDIVKREGGTWFRIKYWWYLQEMEKEAPSSDSYTTLLGEEVKSEGEKCIADYLFENGIEYTYEKSYTLDRILFKPDFSLIGAPIARPMIIEFWGLDTPEYLANAEDKRTRYANNNIILIEVTPKDIRGQSFTEKKESLGHVLRERLAQQGIYERTLSQEEKQEQVFQKRFSKIAQHILAFIKYARVQCLTPAEVTRRLEDPVFSKSLTHKDRFFTEMANRVFEIFLERIKDDDLYDFSRLLEEAANIVKEPGGDVTIKLEPKDNGTKVSLKNIKWILIDEFQDFSPVLNVLISAIQEKNESARFVCVGDDWQAINGFAGSTTDYMEHFERFFGRACRAYLPTNLRSGHAIVDAGNNLMKEYGQKARTERVGGHVFVHTISPVSDGSARNEEMRDGYIRLIQDIIQVNPNRSIVVLHRTNKFFGLSQVELTEKIKDGFYGREICVSTIHKYKGCEADIAILVNATRRNHPFMHPERSMKRVLGLDDEKIILEEKRLFYVAVTRARDDVYILTEQGNESPFIAEMMTE